VHKHQITDGEKRLAYQVATIRQQESRRLGLKISNHWRSNPERFQDEIIGALGEIVWAHHNGRLYHSPLNEFHDIPDDGNVEVRATAHPSGGLIIRESDHTDRKYVFIQIDEPYAIIWGWAYGWEVRQPQHEWNPGGHQAAWRVGRTQLRKITTLKGSPDYDYRPKPKN